MGIPPRGPIFDKEGTLWALCMSMGENASVSTVSFVELIWYYIQEVEERIASKLFLLQLQFIEIHFWISILPIQRLRPAVFLRSFAFGYLR